MEYEEINVQEYWGNDLVSTRKAKLFTDGRLEYEPEPDFPDDEEEIQEEDEEDE